MSLDKVILGSQTVFLDDSSLQGRIPWDLFKQISEEAAVCSTEVQGCDPAFCSTPSWCRGLWYHSSQDPEFRHLIVTAAKSAFGVYIPNELFLVCEYEV